MSTEVTGLLLRGSLLKATTREVKPKSGTPFTVYEARVLADDDVKVCSFYDASEMASALGSSEPGAPVELPVYCRAANGAVYLHYRRSQPAAA